MKYRDESCPCYKCDKRSARCHSSCEEYKAYAQANSDRLELESRRRDEEAMMYEIKVRGIKKVTRKDHTR